MKEQRSSFLYALIIALVSLALGAFFASHLTWK